jgi:hypothetical protein
VKCNAGTRFSQPDAPFLFIQTTGTAAVVIIVTIIIINHVVASSKRSRQQKQFTQTTSKSLQRSQNACGPMRQIQSRVWKQLCNTSPIVHLQAHTMTIQVDLRQNTLRNPRPCDSCAETAAAAKEEDLNGKTSDNERERRDHRT